MLQAAQKGAYDVQIAPGVLYEALRLRDSLLRRRLVRLMTNPRFVRLMPEAYSEGTEILGEVKRVRPEWLHVSPDIQFYNRLYLDWKRKTGGFWVRCARNPDDEAKYLQHGEGKLVESARAQTKAARKEMIDARWNRNPPLNEVLGGLNQPLPGWNGEMIEAWRIDSLVGMTYALSRPGNAYRDWMGPFIQPTSQILGSASWVKFWLHDADKSAMPRQWMRWAHSFVQRFRKVTNGSPGDTQLFTYLLETDLFITADKALGEILDDCRPFAPAQLPEGKVVPAGAAGVEKVLQMLKA